MSSIERYGGGSYPGFARREARDLARTMGSIQVGSRTDLARIDAAGQLFGEILTMGTQLTQQALMDTVQVAQAEAIGAQMAPHAAGRLQYLANMHTMGQAAVVMQAQRALGRLAQ